METHLLLAERVGLTTYDEIEGLVSTSERVGKMLRALIRALQSKVKT